VQHSMLVILNNAHLLQPAAAARTAAVTIEVACMLVTQLGAWC
jgi:hypothetical protein